MVGNVAEQHNASLEAFSQTLEFARVNSQLERGPIPPMQLDTALGWLHNSSRHRC
jgi:hypothetical protein